MLLTKPWRGGTKTLALSSQVSREAPLHRPDKRHLYIYKAFVETLFVLLTSHIVFWWLRCFVFSIQLKMMIGTSLWLSLKQVFHVVTSWVSAERMKHHLVVREGNKTLRSWDHAMSAFCHVVRANIICKIKKIINVELNSFVHNMNIKQKLQLGICLWVSPAWTSQLVSV